MLSVGTRPVAAAPPGHSSTSDRAPEESGSSPTALSGAIRSIRSRRAGRWPRYGLESSGPTSGESAESQGPEHLCEKMPRAHLTRWHFQPRGPDAKYADHFRWVKKPDGVVARIREWLQDGAAQAIQ